MSARPARPPATLLDLTPAQVRIANKIALGQSTETIASDLTITAGTINVQMKHCGQKLGVRGRAAVVHACFVTWQLQRPEKAAFPEAFSDEEIKTWRMVAAGATSKDYAEKAGISSNEALRRFRALRERVKADNGPHLVSLGWRYGGARRVPRRDGLRRSPSRPGAQMTRSGRHVSGSCQAIHLYANTECIRLITVCGVAR